MCMRHLKTPALKGANKSVTENWMGAKKNRQIKGMISGWRLIVFHIIQISHIQIPKS